MLPRFNVIVAVDNNNGISKNGDMPWKSKGDMNFFRKKTIGNKKNAVVMGRKTYESIPKDFRPLNDRHNIVISRTLSQDENPEIQIFPSFLESLENIGSTIKNFEEVFVIGGESIYNEVIKNYLYLIDHIYITKFKYNYDCDQFFPYDEISHFKLHNNPMKYSEYTIYDYMPDIVHPEYQYLDILKEILENGELKNDRTGTGTKSIFGDVNMKFDISQRLPIITTKKIFYESCIKEMLFFISGKTDAKILEEQGVKYWKGNTSREFLDSRNLFDFDVGDMGYAYGFLWRHFSAEYKGCNNDYTNQGVDQFDNLIKGIMNDPQSRRHIIIAWDPSNHHNVALPPCHILFQFNVSGDNKYLDCKLYQRSGDMFLGVPFNILMYSMLTYMVAHLTNLKPRYFYHTIGDAHIYNNHILQVEKQLKRTPRPFPILKFKRAGNVKTIDDFKLEHFYIEGYQSCPYIKGDMAV